MHERGALNILLVVLAAVPVVVTIVNFALARANHALQVDVARRQHVIVEGAQLARVNQLLIRQIALAAIRKQDRQLHALLSRNGITIKVSHTSPAVNGRGG